MKNEKDIKKRQPITSGLASGGVWLVRHFSDVSKFCSRPNFAEAPPARQAAAPLHASRRTVYRYNEMKKNKIES